MRGELSWSPHRTLTVGLAGQFAFCAEHDIMFDALKSQRNAPDELQQVRVEAQQTRVAMVDDIEDLAVLEVRVDRVEHHSDGSLTVEDLSERLSAFVLQAVGS